MTISTADLDNLETNIKAADDWVGGGSDTDGVAANGRTIKSITKVNAEAQVSFDNQLSNFGFEPPILFASGINVNRNTLTVEESSNIFAPLVSEIPFTTTGTFNAAQWYIITDFLPAQATHKNKVLTTDGSTAEWSDTIVNITFPTLTGFLSETTTPSINDIVEFKGFATSGDGGGAKWKHNGNTGQTVSQSPAQLGGALLNDASGNQWALVREGNFLELAKLGAKAGDDITLIRDAAISEIGNDGGVIILPYALEDNPCLVSTQATIRANVRVQGLGIDQSWIKATNSSNINVFSASSTNHVHFSDFSIDGNNANQTAGNGIRCSGTSNIVIDEVRVKNIHGDPCIIENNCSLIDIGTVYIEGGGTTGSRGVSLSDALDVTIESVTAKEYTGSIVNVGGSERVSVGTIRGFRDFVALGWTGGKAAFRCTNESKDVSVESVNANGWSRGVFILTGSIDIAVGPITINNTEGFGVWVEGDDGGATTGASNVTFAGGTVKNSGIASAENASIRLSDTTGNIVKGFIVDDDIEEVNTNATSNKNIITSNRVLGAVNTVGANTINDNNIVGA